MTCVENILGAVGKKQIWRTKDRVFGTSRVQDARRAEGRGWGWGDAGRLGKRRREVKSSFDHFLQGNQIQAVQMP